jgi:hypothetical protein
MTALIRLFILELLFLISTTYLKAQMNESLIYSNKKIFFINNSQLMPNVFLPSKKIVFSGNFFDGNQFMNVEENRVLFDNLMVSVILNSNCVGFEGTLIIGFGFEPASESNELLLLPRSSRKFLFHHRRSGPGRAAYSIFALRRVVCKPEKHQFRQQV